MKQFIIKAVRYSLFLLLITMAYPQDADAQEPTDQQRPVEPQETAEHLEIPPLQTPSPMPNAPAPAPLPSPSPLANPVPLVQPQPSPSAGTPEHNAIAAASDEIETPSQPVLENPLPSPENQTVASSLPATPPPVPASVSPFSPDIQKIVDKGELVVAMTAQNHPPFFMIDKDERLIGLDIEMAKKMADALNVKLRFNRQANSFDEVIDIIANGQADVGISKLSFTLPRAKKVLYSQAYMTLKKTFLINRLKMSKAKGSREAETLYQLMNHPEATIGIISNSSYINYAKQLFPKSTIIPLETWGIESLHNTIEGKTLAVFRDDMEISKLIRQAPDSNFHVLPVTLKNQTDTIHIVVAWDKGHFLKWINGFLKSVENNLSIDTLLNRYNDYFQWAHQKKLPLVTQQKEAAQEKIKEKEKA